jgi:hypothetical protein
MTGRDEGIGESIFIRTWHGSRVVVVKSGTRVRMVVVVSIFFHEGGE